MTSKPASGPPSLRLQGFLLLLMCMEFVGKRAPPRPTRRDGDASLSAVALQRALSQARRALRRWAGAGMRWWIARQAFKACQG